MKNSIKIEELQRAMVEAEDALEKGRAELNEAAMKAYNAGKPLGDDESVLRSSKLVNIQALKLQELEEELKRLREEGKEN